MSINPYESSQTPGEPVVRTPGRRFRLIEWLVVAGIIGVLVAMLLPAMRPSVRGGARRMLCANHLKQIALALQNYESVYHCLPPAHTMDAAGKPLHSWRTLILPFMQQRDLYEKIDLSRPWDDQVNQAAYDTKVIPYTCPSSIAPPGHTTYLAVVGPTSCLRPREPRPLAEITDDHDLTLIVIEADAEHAVHWMSPTDADEEFIVNLAAVKRPSHPNGVQGAFVSGRVSFLTSKTPPAVLRAMVSAAGNDDSTAQGGY